jgi:predicted type IV restriction endonuclease
LAQRVFESEREVEYYFIVPLLEQLGYVEDDFAIGYPVQMYEGVKKVNKEADFVMFNGLSRSKDDALLVVEAKKTERIITEDAVGQARAYAMWLTTPYYLATNGDDLRVYLFRGAVQPDLLLMTLNRKDLRQHWPLLYQTLHKPAVIEYKQRLGQVLDGARLEAVGR